VIDRICKHCYVVILKKNTSWTTVAIDVLIMVWGKIGQKNEARPSTALTTNFPDFQLLFLFFVRYDRVVLVRKTTM
jgi:hypothetical protein